MEMMIRPDSEVTPERPLLITGASGFLGEHLTRYFLRLGWRVAGTYLTSQPNIPGAELIPFDVTDEMAWRRLIRDMRPAAIIHCAAKTRVAWVDQNPEEAHRVNVEATVIMARVVAEMAPKTRVLYISTDMVFGGDEAPYGETSLAKPCLLYGSQKFQGEAPVLALSNGSVVRTSLIYGQPTACASSFLSWMVEGLITQGELLTLFEDEWRTPIFVEDLAAAIETLLDYEVTDVTRLVHAAGAERLHRYRMGEKVCEVFELPRTNLVKARRDQVKGAENRPQDLSLRCERLLSLGWSPISFRDGLIRCRDSWNAYK